MSGECEKCGEHAIDCVCLNEKILAKIHSAIIPIYEKYKNYPNELVNVFEFFIETVDEDEDMRLDEEVMTTGEMPQELMDKLMSYGWRPLIKERKEDE